MSSVLVVDDDEDLLQYLQMHIESLADNVITAKNGTEAIESIKNNKPSLVLLDWLMPGMDGIKTLEKIKVQWPDLPVIMVSAVTSHSEREKAMKAGATDFITKPLDLDYIKASVMTEILE